VVVAVVTAVPATVVEVVDVLDPGPPDLVVVGDASVVVVVVGGGLVVVVGGIVVVVDVVVVVVDVVGVSSAIIPWISTLSMKTGPPRRTAEYSNITSKLSERRSSSRAMVG
jgi:hypothetical protein